MEFSNRLTNDLKTLARTTARTRARMDREIESGIESYSQWCSAKRMAGERPLYIVAEGDSWFRYVVGKAVIFQLERKFGIEILNLASPGDEISEMMSGKQKARLEGVLQKGPTRRRKFDFLLLSGGGNDLVGQDRFYKWFHDYKKGMTATDVINPVTFGCVLDMVEVNFRIAIEARDEFSPKTHLLLHSYDFAIPDGRGVCWLGPWMLPGLKQRKVPASLRREVVRVFLRRFDARLKKIARSTNDVSVVPTQGTLTDKQWANELHATNRGFGKIADVFADSLRDIVDRPVAKSGPVRKRSKKMAAKENESGT